MKKMLLLIGLFTLSYSAVAQNFELKGRVTQKQQALQGVDVYVPELEQGTFTDENGYYVLNLPPGHYQLIFSYGNQKVVEVELTNDKILDVDLTAIAESLDAVFVSAYRVNADSPITFSDLKNSEIEKRNLGQDVPVLMNTLPSVVTTSDAGAGVGYTGIRVRGSDANRINTSINGVPLNDGESQGVFWVNLGDFTSVIQNIQLQRGVGTSTNGAGAFGASLNILTDAIEEKPRIETTQSWGSFNTHKHQLALHSGLINDRFSFSGNFNLTESDGYRDRSFSDLKSYFVQAAYINKNTFIKALGFGGSQQTYQAYYGISKEQMKENRKYNPAGGYRDADGVEKFYENQTDNYKQHHFQLLWNQKYDTRWSSNLTFYYTRGKGYYESYHADINPEKYDLESVFEDFTSGERIDLINQKWLDNHLFGNVLDWSYRQDNLKLIMGGGWSRYTGDHYGKFINSTPPVDLPKSRYYDNRAYKTDYNTYVKATWAFSENWSAFGDLQLRGIHYKVEGPYEREDFELRDRFLFFNPKWGLTYRINSDQQVYGSFARAHREPNRSDYKSAILGKGAEAVYPKAEKLNDYEAGWRYAKGEALWNVNLFYMDYHDQLVLTGEMDPEGRTLRKNSGRSYRLGVEIEGDFQFYSKLRMSPNLTWSRNKNREFTSFEEGVAVKYEQTDISFSPQWIVGNSLNFQPLENLTFGLFSKYVGEQYMSNTEAKESILNAYFTTDLSMQWSKQDISVFKSVTFKALVNNIGNKKYSSNGTYSPDYGALYYPQAGTNFLLGISLKI